MTSRTLGAFELRTPIASGGMGDVWLAKHESTQALVAVKVLAESASDPVYIEGFKREVKAVARLHHPRIITVFDYGLVPADIEGLSGGSPWLAMELATRGSLANCGGINNFDIVASFLFDILDGLAHSHSRGIIHRDLKPGNVLLVDEGGTLRAKLTDFGIAHASRESSSTREVFASSAGTPWYMAPEQIESRWRDYGPSTDLYALGCLAYELVAGHTPFDASSAVGVARKQLFDEPPELAPRFEIPHGFHDWIRILLSKRTRSRFARAADAAWALRQLTAVREISTFELRTPQFDADSDQHETHPMLNGFIPTTTSPGLAPPVDTLPAVEPGTDTLEHSALTPMRPTRLGPPPIGEDWRPPLVLRARQFAGAGLGLFGLRETPFVGREDERDIIWNALRTCAAQRDTQIVAVRGPIGAGKTRLVEWMAQRCDEIGAATVLWVDHGPSFSPRHGLPATIERYLGCTNLDEIRTYERAVAHFLETLSPTDASQRAAETTRILRPLAPLPPEAPPVTIETEGHEHHVLASILRNESQDRPLIVVLDNVLDGLGSLNFVNLLTEELDVPVLFLLTADSAVSEDHRLAASMLNSMPARTTEVVLDHLDDDLQIQLLNGVLGLDPSLRDHVVRSSKGSPLFSLQLLEEWVARDLLIPGPGGYDLAQPTEIPATLTDLWLDRVKTAVGTGERDFDVIIRSLEVAAHLGAEVRLNEWLAVAHLCDLQPQVGLVDLLADRALATWTDSGWSFAHPLLRQALVDHAIEHERSRNTHRIIAAHLEDQPDTDEILRRRAAHLVAAHEMDLALSPLVTLVENQLETGHLAEAGATIERARRAASASNVPTDDPRYLHLLVARMNHDYLMGDLDELKRIGEKVLRITTDAQHPRSRGRAMRLLGMYAYKHSNFDEGLRLCHSALSLLQRAGDKSGEGEACRSIGWLHQRTGRLEEARRAFERGIRLARETNDLRCEGGCLSGLSEVARAQGLLQDARALAEEAHSIMQLTQDKVRITQSCLVLGMALREENSLDEALEYFERGRKMWPAHRHDLVSVFALNVAHIYLLQGKANLAMQQIRQAEVALAFTQNETFKAFVMGYRACAAALLRSPSTWDKSLRSLDDLWPEGLCEIDISDILGVAGEFWLQEDDAQRAHQAFAFAYQILPPNEDERRRRFHDRLNMLGAHT